MKLKINRVFALAVLFEKLNSEGIQWVLAEQKKYA
jgi:hypothetical protein